MAGKTHLRSLSEILGDVEARWKKARKTKRVSRGLASALIYGFVTGLTGATGIAILFGCVIVAIGGAAFPVGKQCHQFVAGVTGFACYITAAAVVFYLA